jgi:hypothetical protein
MLERRFTTTELKMWCFKAYLVAYGIGSFTPAAAKARKRNTQLSQTPQA